MGGRALLVLAVAMACGGGARVERPALESEEQKAFYALGAVLARQLADFRASEAEVAALVAGLTDAHAGRELHVDVDRYAPQVEAMRQQRGVQVLEEERALSARFLEEQAALTGAVRQPSGLIYTELRAGTGGAPSPADRVRVHYHGTLRDGKVFDSSVERGTPAEFALDRVIPCWTEGVALMKVGGKSRLVCPAQIAYGDRGTPGGPIPPGAALSFEIELLEVLQ